MVWKKNGNKYGWNRVGEAKMERIRKYFKWGASISSRNFDVLVSDSLNIQKYYREHFNTDSVMIAYGAYPKKVPILN